MDTQRIIDLNGTWELSWRDGERGPASRPGILERISLRPRQSFTARVPGEVHLDLLAAGIIEDPVIGLNCLAARWVEEAIWVYRRSFGAPKLEAGERAFLRFDRLELSAVVRLNGTEVGRHSDAFLPACMDVTDRLRDGENLLVVEVESGLFSAADRPWEGWDVNDMARLTKRHWLRTVQSSAAWDWAQRLMNVGITGPARLEICRGVRVDGCSVLSDLDASLERGVVTGHVFVDGLDEEERHALLAVEIEGTGARAQTTAAVGRGAHRITVQVPVASPEPWWPVGQGSQRLYDVRLVLTEGARVLLDEHRRVGFRHVRVNQDHHPAGGRSFVIEVNHRPIFCKGGNFVPADPIPSRLDQARYAALVDRALEANFTMLRVWGGGRYESSAFFELCDQQGILVWQEFVFACAKYPATDARFLDVVKKEARYQARRLAHHASLVAWCGNNEIEWADWSPEHADRGMVAPDYYLFHCVLPRILAEEDGTRYYQPSSPYSPDLHFPNCDDCGDQHPWSVGFGDTDFRKYRSMTCRFPNEGGILGPTALPTIRACLEPQQERPHSFAWEVHENSIAAAWDADGILEQWLGRSIEELHVEDWAYLGGLLQGIGLSEYIRNFRRRMFSTSSAIFWMYNDCWPMVRSWTILDYYLRRTPSFHPVRRAFAPLTVVLALDQDTVKVFCVNDGPAVAVEVRFGIFALSGGYPLEERVRLSAAANVSTLAAQFPAERWRTLGERTHAAFAVLSREGREVARDTLFLPLFRQMQWPEARVRVRRTQSTAVFESDSFAWRVCLDLDGERCLPDNFFDLLPGLPCELAWPAELGEPRVLRVGNSEVRSGG